MDLDKKKETLTGTFKQLKAQIHWFSHNNMETHGDLGERIR